MTNLVLGSSILTGKGPFQPTFKFLNTVQKELIMVICS